MEENTNSTKKQSVAGFRIINFAVKKAKDTEKIKLVLEADIDSIGAGECNLGEVMKALLDHSVGEVDVGLSLFVNK